MAANSIIGAPHCGKVTMPVQCDATTQQLLDAVHVSSEQVDAADSGNDADVSSSNAARVLPCATKKMFFNCKLANFKY